jgi:tRNA threonylcarbamoyladenosine biosynthesis protein TsaE
MFRLEIPSHGKLNEAARKFLDAFPGHRVFAFYGEMGAGKTTFIKSLCRALGVPDVTSSPSFGIINEYRYGRDAAVYHFDFYRIRKLEEVYDIGCEEYFYSGDYCFMEWPELVEEILPDDTVKLSMVAGKDGVRILRQMS